MKKELTKLIDQLRQLGCGLPDRLAKGTKLTALAWFPHPLPAQVREWWEVANGPVWRKGDVAEDVWLKPGFYPLSLDEAREDYIDNAGRFADSWLPIMTDGGGDFLVVDCADEACPILLYQADGAPERIYDSLELMVRTLSECVARNVFFIDADGHFETDDDSEASITSQLNPNSDYWADFL